MHIHSHAHSVWTIHRTSYMDRHIMHIHIWMTHRTLLIDTQRRTCIATYIQCR